VAVTGAGDLIIGDAGNHQVKVIPRAATPTHVAHATGAAYDHRAHGNSNRSTRNWSGGDGTYSLRLPDGRIVWFFADSYAATATVGAAGFVNADHSRVPQAFTGNQLVMQSASGSPPSYQNVWRTGAPGVDYIPAPANHRYWPFAPFMKDPSTMSVLLRDFDASVGRVVGIAVVDIPLATMQPSTPHPLAEAFVPSSTSGCVTTTVYGDAVLVDPDGSGHTYVYGTEACAFGTLFVHVARIAGTDLVNGSWEYWTGSAWSPEATASGRLHHDDGTPIADAGHELSVVRTADGYRMLWMRASLSGTVQAATAPAPTGPFTTPTSLYDAPDHGSPTYANAGNGCSLITYNAKEHPALAKGGEVVFSYNVNVDGFAGTCANALTELWHQVDNYRPRFIAVPESALESSGAPAAATSTTTMSSAPRSPTSATPTASGSAADQPGTIGRS
jgi:hypothetical protein